VIYGLIVVIELFFFQKKKQKALFCFAEDYSIPDPGDLGRAPKIYLV
jgi:hypothetical protein